MGAHFVHSKHLFILVLNCYLGAVPGRLMRKDPGSSQDSDLFRYQGEDFSERLEEGMLSQHMLKLYEKYNRENRFQEGNTVRSFQANQESADLRMLYQLNLTALQDTEIILSATFHFLFDRRPRQKAWFCKRFKNPYCQPSPTHTFPSISLIFRTISSGSGVSLGSVLGNVTFQPHRRGVWQMKDVTQVIREAQDKDHPLVSVELVFGEQYQRQPSGALLRSNLPYLLVYANDQALSESNSVAASLQRYDPFSDVGETLHASHSSLIHHRANSSPETLGRAKREAAPAFGAIHDNELPGVDYRRPANGYRKEDLWESTWYLAFKPKSKPGRKEKKRKTEVGADVELHKTGDEWSSDPQMTGEAEGPLPHVPHVEEVTAEPDKDKIGAGRLEGDERRDRAKIQGGRRHHSRGGEAKIQSPELNFDERTMRKARRRQWGEEQSRACSRRNLRVDFADIGWSEWVIAPKAFEAYYCSGTCGFPMPKVVRPSNHATIQSIVRAVGIIPGVPEPCCVPESMSPLTVLYWDEARNLVLKVYPNMSVQSCSCR